MQPRIVHSDLLLEGLMRLLFVTEETCPTFRPDVHILFGKYMPELGVRSDIVAGRTPGHAEPVSWGGGETLLCDVSGGATCKRLRVVWNAIVRLWRMQPKRYDAIQVRDMPVLATWALVMARRKGLPLYYWMSYPMPEGQIALARERGLSAGVLKFLYPWVSGRVGRWLLYRVVLPRVNHVFVQSERMREDLVKRGLARERMTPVPMGVDPEAMALAQIRHADDPRLQGRRVLVYLGTQDRPRRLEVLFDMLALLRQRFPAVLLVMVGDTEDAVHRQWLRDRAVQAGVADLVLWTGWLPAAEGWRYVAAAELGLSPFPRGLLLDSASPTKVPEYAALGLPVVCNDNPDQQALVQASGAGLCVPYTAQAFADAVARLLTLDAPALRAMGDLGRRYVTTHRHYASLARDLAGAYAALASTRPRSDQS